MAGTHIPAIVCQRIFIIEMIIRTPLPLGRYGSDDHKMVGVEL